MRLLFVSVKGNHLKKDKLNMKLGLMVLSFVLVACPPIADIAPGGGNNSETGQVFISSAELLIMESYPVQVALSVNGELPTPCHDLVSEVEAADEDNRIYVSVASQFDSSEACIQVLEAFSTQMNIGMQGASDGIYSVWLNGELVGEFSYPG